MPTSKTSRQSGKKTTIPPKPNTAQHIAQLDQFVTGATTPTPTTAEPQTPIITPSTPDIKIAPTVETEKAKMKRLTLDISEDLHKAIKMQSVTLGIPMVDMLRTLLESNYRSQ
jgi:hypothetical protein